MYWHAFCDVLLYVLNQCLSLYWVFLFSSWFCHDNQSAMNRSGPGLYSILIMWRWIVNTLHWSFCNNVATSSLKIATSYLWSVIILIFQVKQLWWNVSSLCNIVNASLNVAAPFFPTGVRLLLASAVSLGMLLWGASSHGQFIPSLICSNPAPSHTPDASVSRYRGFIS